ncbi:MAG: C2 family cysteine protease [Acidimicrobiia bacterium]
MPENLFADIFDIDWHSTIELGKANKMEDYKTTAIGIFENYKEKFTNIKNAREQLIQRFGEVATEAQTKIDELSYRQRSIGALLNQYRQDSRDLSRSIRDSIVTDNAEYRAMVAQYSQAQTAIANQRNALEAIEVEMTQLIGIKDLANAKKGIHESVVSKDQSSIDEIELIIELLNHAQGSIEVRQNLYRFIIRFGDELEDTDSFFGFQMRFSQLRNFRDLLDESLLTVVDGEDNLPFMLDGISPDDVRQGVGVGDCWIVSILSSIAHGNPDLIRDIIQVTGQNTYRVRLYDVDGNIIYVDVTQQDLENFKDANGNNAYRTSEEWVSVIEAALAKSAAIYNDPDRRDAPLPNVNGGTEQDQTDIYRALTGNGADEISSGGESIAESIYRSATFDESEFAQRVNSGGVVWAGTGGENSDAPPGYVPNHAFSVIRVFESDGTTYVTLRNPWGTGDNTDNGYFTITMDEFRDYWNSIFIGQD